MPKELIEDGVVGTVGILSRSKWPRRRLWTNLVLGDSLTSVRRRDLARIPFQQSIELARFVLVRPSITEAI